MNDNLEIDFEQRWPDYWIPIGYRNFHGVWKKGEIKACRVVLEMLMMRLEGEFDDVGIKKGTIDPKTSKHIWQVQRK